MPKAPKYILFVCKGNVCRSPFAQRAAKKTAGQLKMDGLIFYSAGLDVSLSLPPPQRAVEAAQNLNISLDDLYSQAVTEEMVRSTDMVLVMEGSHFQRLRRLYPSFRDRIFLLPLFSGDQSGGRKAYYRFNVPDPYGADPGFYIKTFQNIEDCLNGLFMRIRNRS